MSMSSDCAGEPCCRMSPPGRSSRPWRRSWYWDSPLAKGIGPTSMRTALIHPKWRTPAFSLIGQGIWAAALTLSGRYDQLYTYVIYGMVLSYTLTVIGMFLLRWKRPDIPRPYRCTGYPCLPAIYVLIGAAWTVNTIVTKPGSALIGIFIVALGVPGYLFWKRSGRKVSV